MKKLFVLIVVLISSCILFARGGDSQRTPDMNFYGVDFSCVKIFGAKEKPDKFLQAFEDINRLIVTEVNKYQFNTFFTKYAREIDRSDEIRRMRFDGFENVSIDEAIYRIRVMDEAGMTTYNKLSKVSEEQLENLVEDFNTGKDTGYGVIYVAELLDRQDGVGKFIAVCFNIKTKKIIFADRVSGKAGGMGLRNYWASPLAEIFKP
ncbi:MAG: hypothetical protein PHG58_08820 [Clostridia bacterium]|nr:hypothetical protein [Clostridia bacterium]